MNYRQYRAREVRMIKAINKYFEENPKLEDIDKFYKNGVEGLVYTLYMKATWGNKVSLPKGTWATYVNNKLNELKGAN